MAHKSNGVSLMCDQKLTNSVLLLTSALLTSYYYLKHNQLIYLK